MSAPTKLHGKPSELTRLKDAWLHFDGPQRDSWRALFASDTKQADIRQRIRVELGIPLKWDAQLTSFRQWMQEQDARDQEAERQQTEEAQLRELHPDWDAERLRSEVIAGSLRRALVSGDFKGLGMKAVKAGQNEKVISLDTEKFKEGLRTKLESGLAQLAEHIKGNAKAQAAYEAFRATIAETTK